MTLNNILKNILNIQKKIEVNQLPSQGFFYKNDFKIWIKKAKIEDIVEYEYQYEKEDLGLVINRVKKIVEKNIILSEGYTYYDIKSIDIVFLFFEIVKFTNNKQINITFYNDILGKDDTIQFNHQTFNYAKLSEETMKSYNQIEKEFLIDGFRYSIPSIGVENSLTKFLISKSYQPNADDYNHYYYDFLYFLGNKSTLTFEEIDNLIQIFNFDLSDDDLKKIKKIVKTFSNIGKYSLKKDQKIIDVTAKIDLEKIWK